MERDDFWREVQRQDRQFRRRVLGGIASVARRRGMSLEHLAKDAGVPASVFDVLEGDASEIPTEQIVNLCYRLGMTLEDVVLSEVCVDVDLSQREEKAVKALAKLLEYLSGLSEANKLEMEDDS